MQPLLLDLPADDACVVNRRVQKVEELRDSSEAERSGGGTLPGRKGKKGRQRGIMLSPPGGWHPQRLRRGKDDSSHESNGVGGMNRHRTAM